MIGDWNEQGFTLIEIIVTIVVAAILSSMFLQFMGTTLTGSVEPFIRVGDTLKLNGTMEGIKAHYHEIIADAPSSLDDFKSAIQDGNDVENDPYFGDYLVAYSDYITFDSGGIEITGGNRILKVTISDTRGEQKVTALFAR